MVKAVRVEDEKTDKKTEPTEPLTDCGLPFGGCALCNPEQTAVMDQRRADRETAKRAERMTVITRKKMGQDIYGDLPTCPPEWSKKSALLTARSMQDRYGAIRALKKARRLRMEYHGAGGENVNPWALKHWTYVVDYLSSQSEL